MSYIIKNTSNSVKSVIKDSDINISLSNTMKNRIYNNVVDKVNAHLVFENERSNCNNYRIIFNIKPYCTNVLFNPFTEIVKYKDSSIEIKHDNMYVDKATLTTERVKYIQDTSISRVEMGVDVIDDKQGFEYYPGFDIFNNHILRDNSFKIVSNLKTKNNLQYNSLLELMYDRDGNRIQMFQRKYDVSTKEFTSNKKVDKHLYNSDDILNFRDGSAINNRLIEDNGWFGFENVSQVKTRDVEGKDIKIDKVINYKNGGDFVDMYPDRSLFSFNPKVNKHLKRLEYNWHYVLTYPFAIDKLHQFCSFTLDTNRTTGLKVLSFEKVKNAYGSDILLFRTYTKHGLKQGDSFRLCINPYGIDVNDTDKEFVVVYDEINVSELGDISGENQEYFFKSENMNVLDSISTIVKLDNSNYDNYGSYLGDEPHNWLYNEEGLFNDSVINEELRKHTYVINRVYNNTISEYYFRLYKRIPNFKLKKEELTPEISIDLQKYQNFIENNDSGEFTTQNSKMGFASSIYNDETTQLVYSDDIILDNMVDHLGREINNIYLTIIKNNKGADEWYSPNNWTDNIYNKENITEIEYSHCFGKLSCGLNFGGFGDVLLRAQNGDINLINELGVYKSTKIGKHITKDGLTLKISSLDGVKREVTEDGEEIKNLFYGDFVEYSPCEAKENVLSECYYRFNTYQREMERNDLFNQLCGWDILSDDYDLQPNTNKEIGNIYDTILDKNENFVVWSKNYVNDNEKYNLLEDDVKLYVFQKPEGYFYNPHYKIPIKQLGALKQESHYDIEVRNAKPIQNNGIYISITSTLKHKCIIGDKIYICDDINNIWYYTYVVAVIDKLTFHIDKNLVNVDNIEQFEGNWLNIATSLNDGVYKVRRENTDIPRYAQRINNNLFIWREILNVGDSGAVDLPEYPYLNNSFYINQDINFYLKRQDTKGGDGLFSGNIPNSFPQDTPGNIKQKSIYEYKDETTITC